MITLKIYDIMAFLLVMTPALGSTQPPIQWVQGLFPCG